MGVSSKYSKTWAAGSYFDLILSSAMMMLLFIATITIIFFTDSTTLFATEELTNITTFALVFCASIGWIMAIHAGIAFDILPLIHGVVTFEYTLLRHYLLVNVAGQALILAGLLTGDVQLMQDFSTAGIALLSWSLVMLGDPGKNLYQNKKSRSDDEVGIASSLPGLLLPLFGIASFTTWVLRDIPGMIELGFAIILVIFLNMINFATILSHFNRRVNMAIIKPKHIPMIFITLLSLSTLHAVMAFLYGRGNVSNDMFSISLGLPFLWIFVTSKPFKLLRNSISKNSTPHSKLILASLFSYPLLVATTAFNRFGIDIGNGVTYALFLFCTSLLCVWGMALYLHEDHLHKSTHTRKTPWLTLLSTIAGAMLIIIIYIGIDVENDGFSEIEILWAMTILISFIAWAIVMVKDVFLGEKDWHKIPMYYDRFIEKE